MNNTCNSSLVPFNSKLENLKDDNFESISFNKENIESENNLIEGFDNNIIEEFSNSESNCQIAFGDKIKLSKNKDKTKGEEILIVGDDSFSFSNYSGRYPPQLYIHPAPGSRKSKGDGINYGDKVMLSKSYESVKFEYNSKRMRWWQHNNEAKRRGGNLASISNAQEWNRVKRNHGYLGGVRRRNPPPNLTRRRFGPGANYWRWVDGTPWTYTAWPHWEPNQWFGNSKPENVLEITGHGWNDIPGNHYDRAAWYKVPTSKLIFTIEGGTYGEPVKYKSPIKFNYNPNAKEVYYDPERDFYGGRKIHISCNKWAVEGLGNNYKFQLFHIKSNGTMNLKEISPNLADHIARRENSEGRDLRITRKSDNKNWHLKKINLDNKINNLNFCNVSGYVERDPRQICSIRTPTFINDGDFKIKEIKIRCDDWVEMWIGARKYSPSKQGWRRVHTWRWSKHNQPPGIDSKGFAIAFKCYNYGGPGCLIAQIELYNGSFIVTDGDWFANNTVRDLYMLFSNTNNYDFNRNFREPNIIGLNEKGKLRWNGRHYWWGDRYFVDSNFSNKAYWITYGNPFKAGHTYFGLTIGDSPGNPKCKHNLTFGQALCYLQGNPDVYNWIINHKLAKYKIYLNTEYLHWGQHYWRARRQGAMLASITNRQEQNYAYRLIRYNRNVGSMGAYIGAWRKSHRKYDTTSSCWYWLNGQPWEYQNFHNHQPDNWRNREYTAHMIKHRSYRGKWNDIGWWYRMPALYKKKLPGDRYDFNSMVYWARWHWKHYGCTRRENRNYKCANPPNVIGNFKYEGCRNDNYNSHVIPTFGGNVNSLKECADIAEKKEHTVFGAIEGRKCFTGKDITPVRKKRTRSDCPTLGTIGGFQTYNRRFPYDPKPLKLKQGDFAEKFTNKNTNKNYIIFIIILILLIMLMYCYMK